MKDYKKYYIINATPDLLYLALTNPTIIKLWSGDEAEMAATVNSEFSLWQGNICGKNLEFIENKKIVQEWYFGEQEQTSIVTILLHEHPKGTSVELRHTNIPDEDYDDIIEGWNNEYFGAIQDFYEEG
ncbi:MAG TPA: SRPBCC domain-containing protein [Chitinophagales bacterium]|jgi:activator of HSP90 ATPase|nr:SRPBCC domain-containing protein [Chitinophagales bacterium]MBP6153748.1 SRPBCC domain-containing protein [Chitinophagales bacterium]HQV78181.1 SRPBCC domain-containing protein [Chitinophagales bacterium]HQW79378.1 SRPBCC domain-containing protein [Chitinophagales bacterium]HRB18658.1 SRPBCC domain-containing protein [Chitinophagales bacterium]